MKKKLLIPIAILSVILIAFGLKSLWDNKQIKANLSSALKHYANGDFDAAILNYEQVIKIDSKNSEAYLGLINSYSLKGDVNKAKITAKNAIAKQPNEPMLLVAEAFYLKDDKNLDEAINYYKKALAKDANNSSALSGLYSTYIEKGDLEAAKSLMDNSIKNADKLNSFVIDSLIYTKDWDKALKLLTNTYKKDMNDIDIYDALSKFNRSDDNFKNIIKEEMQKNASDNMYKLFSMCLSSKNGNQDEVIDMSNNVDDKVKSSIQYKFTLAKAYLSKKDNENADKQINELEKQYPNDFRALHNLGWYYYNTKDYDKAIEYAKKSIAINPNYEDNYSNLIASTLIEQKKYDESLLFLNKALMFNPGGFSLYQNIAELYYKQEKYSDAIPYFEKSLAVQPSNNYGKVLLAISYSKFSNNAKAISLADELINANPNNDDYKFLKGTLLVFSRDYYGAKTIYEALPASRQKTISYMNNYMCLLSNIYTGSRQELASYLTSVLNIAKTTDSKSADHIQQNINALSTTDNNASYSLYYFYL